MKKAEPTYSLLTDECFHYRDKAKHKCKPKYIPQFLLWKVFLKKKKSYFEKGIKDFLGMAGTSVKIL